MKFAEMTQEVQVARPTVTKLDLGFTPGRRQANKVNIVERTKLFINRMLFTIKFECTYNVFL